MEMFDWCVDVGSGVEVEQRVKTAKFGNGYEQSLGDGINTNREIWKISMFGDISVVGEAYQFLKRHGGYKAFQWETPLGEVILVKATELKMPSNGASTYTLTATFTETFVP